jgi:hypothetical protein
MCYLGGNYAAGVVVSIPGSDDLAVTGVQSRQICI